MKGDLKGRTYVAGEIMVKKELEILKRVRMGLSHTLRKRNVTSERRHARRFVSFVLLDTSEQGTHTHTHIHVRTYRQAYCT